MNAGPNVPRVVGLIPFREEEANDAPPAWRWWMDTAIVALLGAGAIIGPLALGGTPTAARMVLDLIVAMAAIVWAATAPRSGWLAWLPVAAAAAATLQLVPLPLPLVALVAPGSARLWQPDGALSWLDLGSVSIDPGATAEGIRRILLGLAAVAVTADLCRDERRRTLLAGCMALAGVAVWVLALAFPMNDEHILLGRIDLRGPDTAAWSSTTLSPPWRTAAIVDSVDTVAVDATTAYDVQRWTIGDGIGPYVVSNHFAAGLYLTIPLLLGLWRARWQGPMWGWGGAALALLVFAAATWMVGVQAHSRAGAGAMVLAGIVFMLLSSETALGRRAATVVLVAALTALVGFALVFFEVAPGLADILPGELRDRLLAALEREDRRALTHGALRIFLSSPLTGTGLGSYGFVSPLLGGAKRATFYAHNDYAQLLAEGGLVAGAGLAAALAALGAALAGAFRLPARERMLAAGVWAALAALALHSFYDWNMHVPANRLLACLLAGLALAMVPLVPAHRAAAAAPPSGAPPSPPDGGSVPWSPRRALAAVVLAGACLATAFLTLRDYQTEYTRMRLRYALASARAAVTEDQITLAQGRLKWGVTRARVANRQHLTDSELPLLAGQAVLHLEAAGEGLVGEDAEEWFAWARARNPLRVGFPETRSGDDPAGAAAR
jgi:O-antigen ligase